VPYRQLLRPPWEAGPGDDWVSVESPVEAMRAIPDGATVFLATGAQSTADFKGLDHARVVLRLIEAPDAPFPFVSGKFIRSRPPYDEASETALFQAERVTHLVSKNAGGEAGRAKLDAARALGIQVIMIERPEGPRGRVFKTIDEAVTWVRGGSAS